MAQDANAQKITLKIPEGKEAPIYANAASVSISQDVILDFGFIPPTMSQEAQRTIVLNCRVAMSHQTAESFLSILQDALLDYRNKSKKK